MAGRGDWSHALVVFSMTGAVADLRAIAALKGRFGFHLYGDDAHGIGVLGPEGRGTAASQGVHDDVDVPFGTFSKSFGSLGGFVAASRRVVEFLRHRARTLIFLPAALPPPSAAAALAALRVLRQEPQLFEKLWANVAFFRTGVERLGYDPMGSSTPIVPLFIGSESLVCRFCCDALKLGVFATPVIHPAVPFGRALVRTSVTHAHTRRIWNGRWSSSRAPCPLSAQ